jgi:hypothetical protein
MAYPRTKMTRSGPSCPGYQPSTEFTLYSPARWNHVHGVGSCLEGGGRKVEGGGRRAEGRERRAEGGGRWVVSGGGWAVGGGCGKEGLGFRI